MRSPCHSNLPCPMRFEYGTRGKPAVAKDRAPRCRRRSPRAASPGRSPTRRRCCRRLAGRGRSEPRRGSGSAFQLPADPKSRYGLMIRGHAAHGFKVGYDSATRILPSGALCCAAVAVASARPSAHAEDGYDLWLRYRPVEAPWLARYRASARELVAAPDASTARARTDARVAGLLGATPHSRAGHAGRRHRVRHAASSAAIAGLHLRSSDLGIRGLFDAQHRFDGHRATSSPPMRISACSTARFISCA